MTFVEAAVQILRREGKPLHIKELTRLAIKHNLLSVVGRDPEAMMETRLMIEAKRPSADLVRVSPGVFGLRTYPPRNERGEAVKSEGEKVSKPKAEPTGTPAKDHRGGKRRRSGRGAEGIEPSAAAAPAETASPAAPPAVVAPAATPAATSSEPAVDEAKPAPTKSRRRTRDRSSASRTAAVVTEAAADRDQAAEAPAPTVAAPSVATPPTVAPSAATPTPMTVAAASPAIAVAPAPVAATPATSPSPAGQPVVTPPAADSASSRATPVPPPPAASRATPVPPSPAPSTQSPARVAQSGTTPLQPAPSAIPDAVVSPAVAKEAPVVATTPERRVAESAPPPRPEHRPEGPAGHHREERQHGHHREDRAPAPPREDRSAPSSTTPAPGAASQGQSQPQQPRQMTLADAAYDVMRGASDGRALTHRHIAEIAVKRRLVRGELVDVSRAMRVALVREQRHRDSEGLRPRIRTVGPGQYVLGERKLEPELYNAERELLDRASRTREATRVALRRQLRQLPAGAFELLMRLLLERMGMMGTEIVKRGDGVVYYGGTIGRGGRSLKVLAAIRPGEGELSKEAVGELRAGVRLRGFDEGMVLCAARAGGAAVTEVSAAPGIELYDQDALTELMIRQHLGVRRMHLPVDYLDTELFNELLDQG